MKSLKTIAIANAVIVSVIGISAFMWSGPHNKDKTTGPIDGKSFAVLELFTSEGCNSCPPAEELLARIERESNGKPVYVLGYHVDYFDNLGWKDAFGSPENTKRQRKYSSWLNAQVYTPQLIINGSSEHIGSNENEIRSTITKQLLTKHSATLSINLQKTGKVVKVNYDSENIGEGDDLLLALVQKNGTSNVLRGENAGLRFSHVQIVRSLVNVPLKESKSGSKDIDIPTPDATEKWEVIGIVQNKKSGLISAVDSATVTQ